MNYIKVILIVFLGAVLPFAMLRISTEYDLLADLAETTLYIYPIYLPVLCGWFGVKTYKETGKLLFPISLFNLALVFVSLCFTKMIFDSIERSLADALIGLLLLGPVIYSFPVSYITAAVYKHKKPQYKKTATVTQLTNSLYVRFVLFEKLIFFFIRPFHLYLNMPQNIYLLQGAFYVR